jgi:pimeloyl-ACP methyl ester carboxylesterase
MEALEAVINVGATLVGVDLSGSGLSEGETISLGWFERDDAAAVIEALRARGGVSTIALWGRSMGAVTALMHGHRDPGIAALVLDSPFSSLMQLANVSRAPQVPVSSPTRRRSWTRLDFRCQSSRSAGCERS